MIVSGWRPGLSKVRLTRIFRDGGHGLSTAVRLTDRLLAGREIRVHLEQFNTVTAARDALTAIGIAKVKS